jgi:predicted RNA polymerase sigma factor
VTGRTDWDAVALLYEGLLRVAPTIGASVGHAAALSEACGPGAGLAALEAIPPDAVTTYQPYWALRAHLLAALGRREPARQAYARAIGLSEDAAVRDFLVGQAAPLDAG